MPFKGFNKCGRCRQRYPQSKLKIEIVEVGTFKEKRLKITCPHGHTWYSRSISADRYIRRQKEETQDGSHENI